MSKNTCGVGGCCGMGCEDCPCSNGMPCNMSQSDCACDACGGCASSMFNNRARIGMTVDDFELEAYHEDKIKNIRLSDYDGKWVVLFFYPADFTFVCPTELEDMADYYEKLSDLGAEVLSISTDTVYVHKAWHDTSKAIAKVKFPMLADPAHELCRYYDVLVEGEGIAMRGTFVIDPDGVLRLAEINDGSIGRNAKELYRKLEAAKYVRENGRNVCPAKWEPGMETITPGIEMVGKI